MSQPVSMPKQEFPMFVMSTRKFLKIYGGQKHPKVLPFEVHRLRGDVIHWRHVPPKSITMYVTHEWTSSTRADWNGSQIRVLAGVLDKLSKGKTEGVHMDPRYQITFKTKIDTYGDEWIEMLENSYIWFDWFSIPQDPTSSKDRAKALRSMHCYMSIPTSHERNVKER